MVCKVTLDRSRETGTIEGIGQSGRYNRIYPGPDSIHNHRIILLATNTAFLLVRLLLGLDPHVVETQRRRKRAAACWVGSDE
jgi:hypothetical protein